MSSRSSVSFLIATLVLAATVTLTGCEPSASNPCGSTAAPPATYDHVVVLVNENRTWTGGRTPAVGMGFSSITMPFLHGLGTKCTYYKDWAETNASQNSLNQYIGMTSGVANSSTINDCAPSETCHSTDDNIFRQVRTAGGTPRNYVDGATADCSVGTNAAKHIPALYYWGGDDQSFCSTEVRPLSKLNPDALPTFAFISPDLCNDGHDCPDTTVDAFDKTWLTKILDGKSYKAGKTLVIVTYDEDRPVPNLIIAPTAKAQAVEATTLVASHADMLKTIELVLGLPVMDQGQLPTAVSLRSSAHI